MSESSTFYGTNLLHRRTCSKSLVQNIHVPIIVVVTNRQISVPAAVLWMSFSITNTVSASRVLLASFPYYVGGEEVLSLPPCGLGTKPVYPSLTMTNKKVDKVEGRGVEGEGTDQSGLQQGNGGHHCQNCPGIMLTLQGKGYHNYDWFNCVANTLHFWAQGQIACFHSQTCCCTVCYM